MGALATVLAVGGLSLPAGAVEPVHTVSVHKDESIVVVEGLTAGDPITVELRRNGVRVGSALGVAPEDGVFELNHKVETTDPPPEDPPDGDPAGEDPVEEETDTAVCWTDSTPEILGGDVVSVTAGGVTEDLVITDIDVTQGPTKVDSDTGIVRGRIRANPMPPIEQLSVATSGRTALDQRFDGLAPGLSDGVVGKLKYTAPGRFQATFNGLSSLQMGAFLDSEDVDAVHVTAASPAGPDHSTVASYGADARFTEDLCPAVERRAVTGASLGVINRSTVYRPLRVWGVSVDATAVRVTVEDRAGNRRSRPATITGTGNQQTWSMAFPGRALLGLRDGPLTIGAEYTEDSVVLAGAERRLQKDTVSPAAPRVMPSGGVFRSVERVRLASPGAREIWYTLGRMRPGRNRGVEYRGEFDLVRSTVVRAIAFDAAGNASRFAAATFRRQGTPAAPRIGRAMSGRIGGLATATIRWRPRALTGGSPLTGFAVTALRMDGAEIVSRRTFRRPPSARSLSPRLLRGEFRFHVRALNRAGSSAPSVISRTVLAR